MADAGAGRMKVLVACEWSGRVRDAFLAKGHDAWSCDLLPSENDERHLQCCIRGLLKESWDLVIAHPPCTYLCLSGVRWLKAGGPRWNDLMDGAKLFVACLEANSPRVCVENPIQHRWARHLIGKLPSQTIQPWQFGHGEVKATCLWLKGLPRLKVTKVVSGRYPRVARLPPSHDRSKIRSVTYQGIADAMAAQWG